MAVIDAGPGATDRATYASQDNTMLDYSNPSDGTGIFNTAEFWFQTGSSVTGVKCGTFHGAAPDLELRDYETIGSVTAGSKQTFTGLSIDTVTGDLWGFYSAAGTGGIEAGSGTGIYYMAGDQFHAGVHTYTAYAYLESIYASGVTPEIYDETGKVQVILAAQGKTDNAIQNEKGRVVIVRAAQGRTVFAIFPEVAKTQVILSTQGKADHAILYEKMKLQIILAALGEWEGNMWPETGREQVIRATIGKSDQAIFNELAKLQTILTRVGEQELAAFIETGHLQTILSVIGGTGISKFQEVGKAQTILSIMGETDFNIFSELNHLQEIRSILGETDLVIQVARLIRLWLEIHSKSRAELTIGSKVKMELELKGGGEI